MSPPASHRPLTGCDGFIIVAVLWLLAALATLVSIYAIYVTQTANAFTLHEDRLRTEALTSAAIELVAYQLTAATKPPRPTHGTFKFALDTARIAVAFQSETARIDLNAAPQEVLAGLFHTLGATPELAATYANRIVRWRNHANDQANNDQTQSQAGLATSPIPAAAPSAIRFFHVDELLLVPGLAAAIAERALPFVTVYNGRSQINAMEAAPEVLASLPGMSNDRVTLILTARQTSMEPKALLQLLGPTQGYATIDSGNVTRIRIHITYANGHQSGAEVIIATFDAGAEPYSVLSWNDDLEFVADGSLRMASP